MTAEVRELRATIDAALGRLPLDLVVRGAVLVNVFTGERYEAEVGVRKGKIVLVGELPKEPRASARLTLDWSGRYLLPGFIDPHFHIGGTQLCATELAGALLRHGTTTIASDLQEIYAYSGARGCRYVLDEAARAGLRILFVPPAHLFGIERQGHFRHPPSFDEMAAMLDWPEAVGINEPPPAQVLGKNPDVLRLIAAALARRQLFPGHLPSVHGARLQAYAAAGASSCHESTSDGEALEKLRLGLWVMMRHGSAGPDMPRVLPLLETVPAALRWSMVSSDEQDVTDLLENGNVNHKLRIAVEGQIDPVAAVQLGTINPALYYRVDDRIGSVAPGKAADLVAVSDLRAFEVTDVVAGGRPVVRDGRLAAGRRPPRYPAYLQSSVRWRRAPTPGDFRVAAARRLARVRVIGVQDGSLVSERLEATLPVRDGAVELDPGQDVLKMAVVDRHSIRPRLTPGFVSGLGLRDGAVASTYCHVNYNALVIGASDRQMALAARKLGELGGGVVVVSGRKVVRAWRLPLVGVFATTRAERAAADLAAANAALREIGCTFSSPILGLSFVALTTIPSYGMTENGLYDVERARFVPVVVR